MSRVLVIEDNRVVQHYILAALQADAGIVVLGVADNGINGLGRALPPVSTTATRPGRSPGDQRPVRVPVVSPSRMAMAASWLGSSVTRTRRTALAGALGIGS